MQHQGLAPATFLVLCGLALAAHALEISRGHLFPLFDEVAYLDLGREFGERGAAGTVACYLSGECREDNRHPLYLMTLAPAMRGVPEDFALAKLASLDWMLLLLLLVFFATRSLYGETAGWCAAAAVALSPGAAAFAQNVSADGLFALLYCAALWALMRWRERQWGWALFGFLAGAAWLAKGNGHFLLLGGLAAFLYPFTPSTPLRAGLPSPRLRRGEDVSRLLSALAGFTLGGSFLLVRNLAVWGSAFHHVNARQVWLDRLDPFWDLQFSPKWDEVGALWYWRNHTPLEAAQRLAGGAAAVAARSVKALAVGPEALWGLTGMVMLALVLLGLRRSWREGRRAEVLIAGVPGAFLLLAFAWAAPVIGANLRYLLPIAVSVLPFAAHEAAERLRGRERWLRAALALGCASMAVSHWKGLAADPRAYWGVSLGWRQTSLWIRDHVDAGGYLADPASVYSEWDAGPVRRKLLPLGSEPQRIEAFLQGQGIRYILVDGAIAPPPEEFLGRKRCYMSDDGRFHLFCD